VVSVDLLAFGAFPYVAVVIVIVVSVLRYFTDRFSYSSLSSQFLENRKLFWGSTPWHYGILFLLLFHLVAFLFPGLVAALYSSPFLLYFMESLSLGLGLLALFGLGVLIVRRFTDPRIRAVTSKADVTLLVLLLFQVATGVSVAILYRWGSNWYIHTAVPYLWSLVSLRPQIEYMVSLPLLAQLHVVNAFALVTLFPFTRLVHLFTFPITYLWRPYQVVLWNRRK
jgi:nitrate reductase gamma subunit